jgi:iron(III) transport system ATP-binding protein
LIRISSLDLTYHSSGAQHHAVRGISLEVARGQFYTLLGPSGCGKTTTLRCVAGLERPDAGDITIGDVLVYSAAGNVWVPPNDRNIGMVFQSYAIWPHMTVFDNVAFPLRQRKQQRLSRAEIRDKVEQALALVQLAGLQSRPAPFLSGGQQQRLALARSLVAEPRVLLLDEPLSNLDAKLREEMRWELRELIKRLNVTTLFVTHEQIEALTMSDVIAVMNDGVIVQEGTPTQIYSQPRERFVADFIGKTNFLDARVAAGQETGVGGPVAVETAIGPIVCRLPSQREPGDALVIAIRPENVKLAAAPDGDGAVNTFAGEVASVMNLGNIVDCAVDIAGKRLRVQLHPSDSPHSGATVRLHLPVEHCLVMRA